MTIQEAKDTLPDVQVSLAGGHMLVTGRVSGRKETYATVTIPCGWGLFYSWQAVARAATDGTPLTV